MTDKIFAVLGLLSFALFCVVLGSAITKAVVDIAGVGGAFLTWVYLCGYPVMALSLILGDGE